MTIKKREPITIPVVAAFFLLLTLLLSCGQPPPPVTWYDDQNPPPPLHPTVPAENPWDKLLDDLRTSQNGEQPTQPASPSSPAPGPTVPPTSPVPSQLPSSVPTVVPSPTAPVAPPATTVPTPTATLALPPARNLVGTWRGSGVSYWIDGGTGRRFAKVTWDVTLSITEQKENRVVGTLAMVKTKQEDLGGGGQTGRYRTSGRTQSRTRKLATRV